MMLCFLGTLLCVLGFVSAVIVSALDKIGMRQLGLDGTIQEQSRKVVRTESFHNNLFPTSFIKCKDAADGLSYLHSLV